MAEREPPAPAGANGEAAPVANGLTGRLTEAQIESPPELEDTPEQDPDTYCGFGGWRPAWLQRLASKKVYVLLHGLIGFHQFATGSYFVATISTMEKRFKIPSKTTGIISSAWDIGSCGSVLIMGYLGRTGHKPRFVAVGMLLMSVACFGRLLPHLLYGPGQDALELTKEYGDQGAIVLGNSSTGSAGDDRGSLCGGGGSRNEDDCSDGGSLGPPSIILFVSSILLGIGSSMYWTLGVAYLDDNTHKDKAPLTLAATSCIRMLGPTIGFSLASYALSQYVDLDVTPLIDQDDPRWIGAWWIGYGPSVALGLVLAAFMMLFPRQLPRAAERRARRALLHSTPPPQKQKKSIEDFVVALRRILRSRVLLFNTLSGVCFMFGLIGYWTFMPKYMETQYRQSASRASLISGSVGLVFSGLGIASSAIVISKFKPRARTLAAWSVCVEVVDVLGHFSWAFLNCGEPDLHGSVGGDGAWNLTAACNAACACGPDVKYEPVCALSSGTTFYSPCHAGCGAAQALLNGTTMFSECACSPDGLVVDGPCPRDCAFNFGLFLATQCLMRLLGSSGKAGNTLIQFRCVHEDDKPLAIAFGEFLLCGLAFIPGPIVYGMLLDSACLVWGEMCGQTGNCWLYDDKKLRYFLNFTAAGCLFCGMSLDIAVWYYCKDLQIYEPDDGKEENSLKKVEDAETPFLEKS
ncbi:hypothetical protein R5R35_005269 [Gryllus longicercus]|uniref:Solute carrier organic anion transporter family member n=1 Tax=Gryllus longicercus TaxID=2509291 RepID=A0AAN9Z893_9ORTH